MAIVGRWLFVAHDDELTSNSVTSRQALRTKFSERPLAGVSDPSVAVTDVAILKSEALSLMKGLKDFAPIPDILPEASRLSAIFREWGRVDFEGAKNFLETEEAARKFIDPDWSVSDELYLAALIGYSGTDPVHAWQLFLASQDYSNRPLALDYSKKPFAHEVASEQIIRALSKKSRAKAVKTLRELRGDYRFLLTSGLRGIMAETSDARRRSEILSEFFVTSPGGSSIDAANICAGIAEHDPGFAWKFLMEWLQTQDLIANDQPEFYFAGEFIESWSRRQPEQALRFIAAYEKGEIQSAMLLSFFETQTTFHPDLIVKALEMDSLKYAQDTIRPDILVRMMDMGLAWPLIDENVPLSEKESIQVLRKAVESSELPQSLKTRFFDAIQSADDH